MAWQKRFRGLAKQMDIPIPIHKPSFLATRRLNETDAADEELIGIFTIAHRCLYAEFVNCRIHNKTLNLINTIDRTMKLIHSRLLAYGKACKDFCNERHYTGRKCRLPKLLSERNIIKVLPDGRYEIHDIITSYVKNIHLFTP